MEFTKGTLKIGDRTYPTLAFEYYGITYTFMTENLDLDVGKGCKYYNDDPSNAQKFGRLYTWHAARKARPEGWDIIDFPRWDMLQDTKLFQVKDLVEGGSSGMNFQYGGRWDGGIREGSKFIEQGDYGFYWSTNEENPGRTARLHFFESPAKGGGGRLMDNTWEMDGHMLSVRLFKQHSPQDDIPHPEIDPVEKRAGFDYGTLVDNRPDRGKKAHTYRTIKLKDGKEWMAENFNFYMEKKETLGVHNEYDTPSKIGRATYGLFYTWDAIEKALPDGWRLPTKEEWQNLIQIYGGENKAYVALMNKGSSGLDLQMAGWRAGWDFMNDTGKSARFWSSSEENGARKIACFELETSAKKAKIINMYKNIFLNIRLIKA